MSESANLRRLLTIAIGVLGINGYLHGASGADLIDPTRPKGWQAATQAPDESENRPVAALQLQGTFSLAGERSAVISGRRVVVGDEVSGAQVLEINRNNVVLRLDGETIELASMVPDVKSPADLKEGPK